MLCSGKGSPPDNGEGSGAVLICNHKEISLMKHVAKNTPLENLEFQGGYNLEFILCPLCGGKDFKRLVVEQLIPIVRCRNCSLAFANPRPDAQGLMRFYENYFPSESAPLWQKQMSQIFLIEGLYRIMDFQASHGLILSNPPRILDVGCGMGFFLDLMRKKGWTTKGVEPSSEAVKHARQNLGLDVVQGVIESLDPTADAPYDVVTLWYVMEHVPNPEKILALAAQFLKPGGLLIIRVPNQNASIDQWLGVLGLGRFFLINPPRHLFDYSPQTMSRFLIKYGFKVLDIRNGIPRKTGTPFELLRRHLWYGLFEILYRFSNGKIIRGSSMTVYAQKQ
ncbi:MAG: class I SAM-dependent methyltransferase [Candidatus Omnitrophica bacterium]|nr:class I SAM-dependent methyltransferase [Candidatus Omnitrophota bacterium]